jgi:hypothetical protein
MIQLNGTTVLQPTMLTEEYLQIQTDQTAVDGSMQRNRMGQKKQATLQWTMMTSSDYQVVTALFSTGSGISYYNDQSNKPGGVFTFSGLPSYVDSQYTQGGSLLTNLQLKIREI